MSRFNTLNRKKHAKKFPLLFSTSDSTDSRFLNILLSNLVYNQIWLKSSYGCWALLLQYKMGKINWQTMQQPCQFIHDVTWCNASTQAPTSIAQDLSYDVTATN
jgi:hypothetical protein